MPKPRPGKKALDSPLRRGSAKTERIGVAITQLAVESELGWIFREQPVSDFGIDAQVELVEDDLTTGKLIALQIRAGKSYLAERTKGGVTFRGKLAHLDYWTQHALPVVLVLCDTSNKVCYWQAVNEENVVRTKTSWKMVVPTKQILNASAARALSRLAEGSPYEQRLRELQLAKPWMQAIQEGSRLLLEAEEWVNKTMSRGSMKILMEGADGTITTEMDWPFLMFPHLPWAFVFPHLFPWANFAVDDEKYWDAEYDRYVEAEGAWDSEDQEYKFVSQEEFVEWRSGLAAIRPYATDEGEVARFRLELSLNPLGESFLELDRYLSTGKITRSAEQGSYGEYGRGLKMLALKYLGPDAIPEENKTISMPSLRRARRGARRSSSRES